MGLNAELTPQGWLVDPIKPANVGGAPEITNASKIKRALAALSLSSTKRLNVGLHGMSIPYGWGSDGVVGYPAPGIAKTNSVTSILSKMLNNNFGGTFTPGMDVIDNLANIFTPAGGAGYPDIYATAGPNGVLANPAGGTLTFTVVGGRAGQVVRVYAVGRSANAVNAIYSLSGANMAVTVQTSPSTPAGNMAPNGVEHWFEFTITLLLAGDTNVILGNAAPSSTGIPQNNLIFYWAVDMDYRTDPGITVHRLCKPGRALVQTCAWSVDDTDVWPVGPNTAADWVGSDAGTINRRAGNLQSMVTRPALDLAICWFDINDCYLGPTGGFTVEDHRRHIQNYLNGVIGLGVPVLFVAGILRRPDTVPYPVTQGQIMDLYRSISDASPDVCGAAFLDLTKNYTATTLGAKYLEQWSDTTFRLAGEGTTPVHPSQTFTALIGNQIASSLIQAVEKT